MKKMTVKEIRDSFLEYFRERSHKIVASSSLIPKDDPTLLFTTAGMVQFKHLYGGTGDLEYTRAATVQKCLRTSDLENVGRTKRHLTLFEMLGNFSFGDYFKKETIDFAYDYSVNVIGFDKEDIWISIFQDDDEAFEIWNKDIGVPAEKIVRLGKEDNFWGPAGETGACGPCSELYIDRGKKYGCGSSDCAPGCECERFLEYWNLVFVQFNQDTEGNLTPLARTGIDTGMGLERLATVLQGVDSVYDTDEMVSLIKFVSSESGVEYKGENITPVNIIVEHARALCFAMADGIYPSNEGRGYVLRRILRRALRYSRQIGIREPFVYKVIDPIVSIMGEYYPEIKDSAENVKKVIEAEEERFLETIENGMNRLDEIMENLISENNKTMSGKDAFLLYDTFGFPLEMTVEIAEEKGLDVDIKGYEAEMANQRERGKQSWKGGAGDEYKIFSELAAAAGDTVFTGYDEDSSETEIIAIHNGSGICETLTEGETGYVTLERTPFYGESGGQLGDSGKIFSEGGALFQVEDTKKTEKTVIHYGNVIKGEFKTGLQVKAEIDSMERNLVRANHTATHLLHTALRQVLGNHVKQAGSLVAKDRLRFDFSHYSSLTPEQLEEVELIVNSKIWEYVPVNTAVMSYDEAVKSGATAVFDEKYDDTVRVLKIGDFSSELCGGTHVANTGQIGLFKILKEFSPGAGMRRIEAVTLKGILERYNERDKIINQLSESLNVIKEDEIIKKVQGLIEENRSLKKEIAEIKSSNVSSEIDAIISSGTESGGVKIFKHLFEEIEINVLRELSDSIRAKENPCAVFFGCISKGKPLLVFAATKDAVEKGIDCGAIIKEAVKEIGGGGGGRKDMAQAGGKDVSGLEKALEVAVEKAKEAV